MWRRNLTVLALAFAQAGFTDCGNVLDDSGFDLWCGEALCVWHVDRGQAARIPTWHRGDDGVELLGDDAAISQMTEVTSGDGDCLRFEAVADVDETVELDLELDVFGDGVVDHVERLPSARWEPVSYRVRLATPYQGVRFRIAKRGPGRARLAQIKVTTASECPSETVALPPRVDGAWCVANQDCASGLCDHDTVTLSPVGVCSSCAGDDACKAIETCGLVTDGPPRLELHRGCLARASKALGERCVVAAECGSGPCVDGLCSTCAPGVDACCARRPAVADFWWSPPHTCPGGGAAGAACLDGRDCASGACSPGPELRVCEIDGRRCAGDGECPLAGDDKPLRCVAVGTAGGRCL